MTCHTPHPVPQAPLLSPLRGLPVNRSRQALRTLTGQLTNPVSGPISSFAILPNARDSANKRTRRNVIDINNMTSNMTSLEVAMSPKLN
jgi:hypothetical protein